MLASHAWDNKYTRSCETIGRRDKQVQASSFQGLFLVTVGSSKPLSAGRVLQPTPSKPQSDIKIEKLAATKPGARSRDVLLEELTAIAAEVTGTSISAEAPLMDSGLDSIGATELSNKISAHLNTELSPTLLFDHPSLRSIADALSNSDSSPAREFEPEQEVPVLPTVAVAHEVPKRAASRTSGNAAQSVSSIIKSIQTTL